jgi:hypothetical protein
MDIISRGARPPRTTGPRLLLIVALLAALVWNAAPAQVALAAGADNLAAATALTPPLSGDPTNTTGATRDAGEVGGGPAGNPCNFPLSGNTHSVWYHYQAAGNGWLQLDTFGSSYDTVLEVFSGPAAPTFASLVSVACNDDSAGLRQSALTTSVTTGTDYYIVVRSYGGGPGGSLLFSAMFSGQLRIYVDQEAGSDNNPGTSALPVKTIQKGVNLVPIGPVNTIVHIKAGTTGIYDESVGINKILTFETTGAVRANAFTLQAGANVTLSGNISAPTVYVDPGASIQNGIGLVAPTGTVFVRAGTYAENISIGKSVALRNFDSTLPVIDPASGDAITISAGTVRLTGLTIQGAVTGVNITGGTAHTIDRNNITTNTSGVINATGSPVNAMENFWGNATGPTHATNPGGTGDSISNNVAYRPWCTTPAPGCLPRAGAPTRLRFTTSPGNTQAGAAFAAQPVVQAEDDIGNVDTTFTGPVTLAIKAATGTAGATLGGTLTVNAVNGVATFSGLSINYVGQNYQLIATSGPLSSTPTSDSAAFNITADRLVFNPSPSDSTAGVAFPTQPVVQATDGFGHIDTTFTGSVTVAIKPGTGTAGATLGGTLTVSAVSGAATFSGLNINLAGTAYQLTASSAGLTGADSATFNIGAGTATQLAFTTSPSNSTAGAAFPTQPVVEARDALGNRDTSYTGAVTLVIKAGTGTGGALLGGTLTVNAVAGVATFSGLSINLPGTAYQLTASSGALATADSTAFNISAGPAVTLVFATSPSDSAAGVAFPTQPVVHALDAGGNLATTFNGTVTVAITAGSGTAGATLAPPANLTVTAVNGVATFSGLNINLAGTAYRLTATSAGLTSADSATFNITAGPATQLIFNTSPGNTPAGVAFGSQPVVHALDAHGNLATTYTGAVTIAIKPGTGTAGAVLGGVLTVNAVNGIATFSGLNIDRIGIAYQLTASAAGLTGADSAAFNITADRLVFTTSPSNSTAGAAFPTQPVLQAVDSFGTLDTNFNGAVTVAIKPGTGTAGATLGGTVTVNAAAGVVTFSGLNINLAGTAYQLIAASGTINSTATGDSAPFNITASAAAQLVFTTSPSNSTAGVAFPTQPVVEARDQFGNLDTSFGGAVTVAIKTGTGTAGATLAPPANLTVTAVNGVATFSGLNIDLAGTAYRLTATSGALVAGDSNTFNITAGAATQLIFTTSPSDARSGLAFATQPVVQAQDAFGNAATGFSGAVTVVIKPGTGTAGATLAGTATVNAVNGVATFSGLRIDLVGTGYQLTASSGALTPADSGTFNITASGLAFTLQPVTTMAGQPILVRVAAQDIAGNTDTTFTGTVTLAIQPGTGTAGATLGGTLTANAVNGVADFTSAGLNIVRVGTGYQLNASSGRSLAPAVSEAFNISAGAPANLAFRASPSDSRSGIAFPIQPIVEVQDQYNNLTTSFSGAVTLAIKSGTGTAGATLNGTTTVNAINGLATFSGLSIVRTGQNYRLTATSAGLTIADSLVFDIIASRLVFSVSPSNAMVGTPFPTQPIVRAEDASGALDATFNGAITLAIKSGTGTPGATLGGTTTINAVNGLATFTNISVGRVGTGYRLTATSGALTSADSNTFNILNSRIYLPILMNAPRPDLVGSFSLTPNSVASNSPVSITVTITNRGTAPASQFWVDFYINPSTPPTDTNQPWNRRCGLTPCYGIAWYVTQIIEPGQSITLTSTPGSYYAQNTRWRGQFAPGTSDLYLYVDSWNPTVATGAVDELDETNNRAEYHGQPTSAALGAPSGTRIAPNGVRPDDMPTRPVRP